MTLSQPPFTCSITVNNRNNKEQKEVIDVILVQLVWYLYFLTAFKHCSGVYIVDFEQVNAG